MVQNHFCTVYQTRYVVIPMCMQMNVQCVFKMFVHRLRELHCCLLVNKSADDALFSAVQSAAGTLTQNITLTSAISQLKVKLSNRKTSFVLLP